MEVRVLSPAHMATIEDFDKLDIRVGEILEASLLSDAKYTTHKLVINFGPGVGKKISGARLVNYSLEELVGKKILGVINFPPRQIGKLMSEALTLGVPVDDKECTLITPDGDGAIVGSRLY